jgi:anti-sigma regulatory factor (Ser/Thr protein kinase)
MYEAEINTIIHGGGGECEADITATAVTLVFTDNGPGIADVSLAMQEGYSTASDEVREMGFGAGMGLPNMKKHTDSMEITTQIGVGTRIVMRVTL